MFANQVKSITKSIMNAKINMAMERCLQKRLIRGSLSSS